MKRLLMLLAALLCVTWTALAEEPTLWPAYDDETGLWGYIDETGAWQIAPAYTYAAHFHSGCAIVGVGPNPEPWYPDEAGIIDETGAYLLEPRYAVYDFCDMGTGEIYFVGDDSGEEGRMGWFNIPNRYFSGFHWYECIAWADTPYAVVFQDRLAGLADRATGEIVLPLEYVDTSVYDYGTESGFVIATRADTGVDELIELGVGPVALPEGVTVDYAYGVSEGLLLYTQEDGLMGYLNTAGEIVIPAQYDDAGPFMDGYANVSYDVDENIVIVIDRTGREVTRIPGENWHAGYAGMVGDALSIQWEDGSWGLVTPEGEVIFRNERAVGYDTWLYEAAPDGPLWVEHSMGDEEYAWGLVSRTGEILREPTWLLAGNVLSDDPLGWQAIRIAEGKWRYVDAYGETVLPGPYLQAAHFEGALARVQFTDAEEGYINRQGQPVLRWRIP